MPANFIWSSCVISYATSVYRIVNLAHDVDLSQDSLLRKCAHLLKTSGHVSPIIPIYTLS